MTVFLFIHSSLAYLLKNFNITQYNTIGLYRFSTKET